MDRAQGTNLALTLMVFHCTLGPSHFLSLYLIRLWRMFCNLFLVLIYEFLVIVSGAQSVAPLFPWTREDGTAFSQI